MAKLSCTRFFREVVNIMMSPVSMTTFCRRRFFKQKLFSSEFNVFTLYGVVTCLLSESQSSRDEYCCNVGYFDAKVFARFA